MHRSDLSPWQHAHLYADDAAGAERRTRVVIAITAAMMAVEIAAGIAFNSMALLADGWHMSTHAAAFLIAAVAYAVSRRHAAHPAYSFGTGKVGVLGGFASAVVLAVIALLMAGESVHRLFTPRPIRFDEAIAIAGLGFLVNVACALILGHGGGDHAHESPAGHSHDAGGHHEHAHHHHDLNLRSAYFHVLADALTSITAIVALLAGKLLAWGWMDPIMGLAGSAIIAVWAVGLLRDTSGILLDRIPSGSDLPRAIRRAVETDGDARVADLHVWQVSAGKYAAIVSIVADAPRTAQEYRRLIGVHAELVHISIETTRCPTAADPAVPGAP